MKPYRRDHHKLKFPTPENEDLYVSERKGVFRKKDFHKNENSYNDEHYYDRDHNQPS